MHLFHEKANRPGRARHNKKQRRNGACVRMMDLLILIGSKIGQDTIHSSLGKPEYSYYFLLKEFLPAFEAIGTVVQVRSVAEVEALYEEHHAAGRPVVFISVSPPQQTPLGLRCPTIPLFAWEFDSLPNVAWEGDSRNDWRHVFQRVQGAIATSREAAAMVASQHRGLPVLAAPAPVWERFGAGRVTPVRPAQGERRIPFAGVVIDSPLLGLSADGLVRRAQVPAPEPIVAEPTKEPSRWRQRLDITRMLFAGWRREVFGHAPASEPSTVVDEASPIRQVALQGVVYTTVLNPADGRKNWIDLITAFCWAFRDTPDAVLLVKMTHHDLEHYRIVLMTLLSRLAPFSCRVVVLHGFLEDDQYQAMVAATDYYVNASSCEGLCLPLMEFLSAGKPALAPRHTAMADSLDEQMAFVVEGALEPTCWPHDPTGMLVTHRHRLNWESLLEAFRRSHAVATREPQVYARMSGAASKRLEAFSSLPVVADSLRAFLGDVLASRQPTDVPVRVAGGIAE
jgi:glycosyltransferase involved in cell wall biosynthesis